MTDVSATVTANLTAAQSGDHRKALVALRDNLASALDAADPNVKAQLAAQYRAVLNELAALPDETKVSIRDDLAGRRADRQSAATAPKSAGRGKVVGGG
jgi:hypothetical protein